MPIEKEGYWDGLVNKEQKTVEIWKQVEKSWEIAANLSSESKEVKQEIFCGVTIDQLTKTQRELFDKLAPKQREEMNQIVYIDNNAWHIHFLKLSWNNAIATKDIDVGVTKLQANDVIKKHWSGWKMPRDIDYDDTNKLTLDPEKSDYDAMIMQMPGKTDNEKIENFILFTGMNWRYWTSKKCNKSVSLFVVRGFIENNLYRDRTSRSNILLVRPVRSL